MRGNLLESDGPSASLVQSQLAVKGAHVAVSDSHGSRAHIKSSFIVLETISLAVCPASFRFKYSSGE
jgi:hypothetical protein